MPSRPYWKGFIRFSLVSVPVQAYTAAVSESAKIRFNQLHKECHQRVQYRKTCPTHGELKAEDIVSGYEFADDQYVIVDESEIEKLRTPRDKAIDIAGFIDPTTIDERYITEKHYYLTPDGPIAQKPYGILHRVMTEKRQFAFAKVVLSNRESIVQLRPLGRLIVMDVVRYAEQMKDPLEFEKDVVSVDVAKAELDLAKNLTDMLTVKEFHLNEYKDQYQERLTRLVQAKVEGKEIVATAQEDAPQVINLMEALQRSVEEARQAAKAAKPPALAASGSAGKAKEARKRKSS